MKAVWVSIVFAVLLAVKTPLWAEPLRLVLAEGPSVENIALLVAVERSRAAGVDIEVTVANGEPAAIAMVHSGTADLGLGTPFVDIVERGAQVRAIQQVTRVAFFAVVENWIASERDIAGAPVLLHAPGSGTEAAKRVLERAAGVRFGDHIYVRGSENRAVALMSGAAPVAFLDAEYRDLVLMTAGDSYHVLQIDGGVASDEVLFANMSAIANRTAELATLVAHVDAVWRDIAQDPVRIAAELGEATSAGPLPRDLRDALPRLLAAAVASGLAPDAQRSLDAVAADDLAAYGRDATGLEADDFWDFRPAMLARESN